MPKPRPPAATKPQPPPPIFPIYLAPTFPFSLTPGFRKRPTSPSSTCSLFSRLTASTNPSESDLSRNVTRSPPQSPTFDQNDGGWGHPTHLYPFSSFRSLTPISSITSLRHDNNNKPPPPPPPLQSPHAPILRCKACSTHLAASSQIISKNFTGRHGRAYLIAPPPLPPIPSEQPFPPPKLTTRNLVNVRLGKNVVRHLNTGQHTVADIECVVCESLVGWKYVDAREVGQRYKVGKFVLEGAKVVVGKGWEDGVSEESTGECREDEDEDEDEEEDDENEIAGRRARRYNIPRIFTKTSKRGRGYNIPRIFTTATKTANNDSPPTRKLSRKPPRSSHSYEEPKPWTSATRHHPTHASEGLQQLHELEIEMGRRKPDGEKADDIVTFDSENEDECDDFFAGVWNAEVVRRRRWRRGYLVSKKWREKERETRMRGEGGGGDGEGEVEGEGEGVV